MRASGKQFNDMFEHLDYGEFFYASVQRHFGFTDVTVNGTYDVLEARVHSCTFGLLSTYVRPLHRQHPNQVLDELDWSKVISTGESTNLVKSFTNRNLLPSLILTI